MNISKVLTVKRILNLVFMKIEKVSVFWVRKKSVVHKHERNID